MISPREPPTLARPNLEAITTSSRRPVFASAAPRNSSDLPPPYISAVTKWVRPASSAALTTDAVSSGPIRMPKLLHPSPSTETASPDAPTLRISTDHLSVRVVMPSGRDQMVEQPFLDVRRKAEGRHRLRYVVWIAQPPPYVRTHVVRPGHSLPYSGQGR